MGSGHASDTCIRHEVGWQWGIRQFEKVTRKTHDAPGKTTSHQGETDEQKESSPPDRSRITEPIFSTNPVLVDQVDDEHAEKRANPWNPVDERDVHQHRFRFMWGFCMRGEDRCIEECPVGEGELHAARYPRDPRGAHARQRIPQDDSRKIRPTRSPTDVRREKRPKRNMQSISGSESICGSEGMGLEEETYQCTSKVNTDRTFLLSEPERNVRAWVHAHPTWVIVGSW